MFFNALVYLTRRFVKKPHDITIDERGAGIVAKLIVLFYGDEGNAPEIAEAAADGAKTIRFAEVDVRAGAETTTRHKRVDSVETLAAYDGVVISAPAGRTHADLATLLDKFERDGGVSNTVFALAAGDGQLLEQLSRMGAVIVTARPDGDPLHAARHLGARVAKVAGWVRHGLGHEAEHQHDPGHGNHHHH